MPKMPIWLRGKRVRCYIILGRTYSYLPPHQADIFQTGRCASPRQAYPASPRQFRHDMLLADCQIRRLLDARREAPRAQ